jgi:hypothetical protein
MSNLQFYKASSENVGKLWMDFSQNKMNGIQCSEIKGGGELIYSLWLT